MDNFVYILGNKFEYDFLSAWIKYNRIKEGISQEALAHGICSTSHLSYFENGKKKLRSELIEALLKKLKITNITGTKDIGLIRQKFHILMFQVESFDYESSEITYNELCTLESLLRNSPYNIEFNIYSLMYNILVERKSYNELKVSINILDKVYSSLHQDLQYIYMLITGRFIYEYMNQTEGIRRLEKACEIKETPWINYRLGVAYCLNWQHLKGVIYLEKALNSYSLSGRYMNSLQCHSFLGSSYIFLKMYEQAEFHLTSVANGSDYFTIDKNIFTVYTNLAKLYLDMGKYDKCIEYCHLAMNPLNSWETDKRWIKSAWHASEQPILGACIYIEVHKKLNDGFNYKEIFDKFLTDAYKNSVYYNYLYCLYLSIFNFNEDIFYKEVTDIILPFYSYKGYWDIHYKITLLLIKHLESKRKYKDANNLYRELLS
ncbi:helix-turn-helix domain-containing protein [Clostridium tagluense]|uniref:helix-turn-helix domain-containing protein n=1 Tax=Clostridium tagluense TaxID=360422 RepID=UPI001C6E593F|nr:helix-turn-helix transcriptional regulator [Clostridium tagluense]MBW9158574.1 helix-turn-helix domain-containing protein [Clostridium tagluense]WLC63691.1 helix-turn-helix domain-containing protein [Clostridium tagluense]